MSNKMSVINVNVPTEVKEEASDILSSLGLNMSSAINMFLIRTIYERGIPFEVKHEPNEEFVEALRELKDMEKNPDKYKSYNNIEDLKKDLLSND